MEPVNTGYNSTQLATDIANALGTQALKAYDYTTKKAKEQATAAWNALPTVTLNDVTGYLNKGTDYIASTTLYKDIKTRACKAYETTCTYCTKADILWGTIAKWGLGIALVTTYLIPHTVIIGMGLGLGMAYGGYRGINQTVPQHMELLENLNQRDIVVLDTTSSSVSQ